MGLASSLEDDLLMIASDDPRSLSYYRRTAVDTYAAASTISGVVREQILFGTLGAAGAVLPKGSVAFHCQARQFSSRPHGGDRVVESTTGYTIDNVEILDEGTRYRLVCIPEVA